MQRNTTFKTEIREDFRPVSGVPKSGGSRIDTSTPSRMAFRGHPIHPILVALPVTLLTSAFFTDAASIKTRDPFWFRASKLLLQTGLISGIASAATGLVDFLLIAKVR